MHITYSSVRDPRWVSEAKKQIHCLVRFDHIPDEEVPFVADPNDVEPHGREIFAKCAAGEFGPVAECIPAVNDPLPDPDDIQKPDAWPDVEKFLQDANAENANGTDRGCVLVWTSMIDELLRRIIEAFLVPDTKRSSEFFGHNGPAGSFSARSKIAYFLGLIAEDELRIIDKLRDIRNDFAHQYGVSLADSSYAGRCAYVYKTMCGEGVRFPPRLQFTSACGSLVTILVRRYDHARRTRREPLIDDLPLHQR
ncbi:hypothetical protein [Ensifer aridi]|uniref:hypothetical protein n=1 Tax=Ensifer aridi TaxID=1708715 RepID=UPI0009BD0B83|nr:hypothetical protein [Ensifer aridi]